MSNEAIEGARSKVGRAMKHLSELVGLINHHSSMELPPPQAKPEILIDGKPGYTWQVKPHPVPSCAPLIVGDVVHNLRSALDLLVYYQMSSAGVPEKKRQFPFAKDANHLERILRTNFPKLRMDVSDYIRSCRPYEGGDRFLRGLHDLDIADKHRIVLRPIASANLKGTRLETGDQILQLGDVGMLPDDDGVLKFFHVVGSDPGRMTNPPVRARLTFETESPYGPFPIDEWLYGALERVCRVIDGFPAA